MDDDDGELVGLDEATRRKVRFVAEYCATADGNAGAGQFSGLPQMVQDDYLHDARNAVEACAEYDKRQQ